MQAITKRMKKALRTGSIDADSALIIFLRDLIRPKSRTTLKALIRRIILTGIRMGPRAIRDIRTTKVSNKCLGDIKIQ